MLLSRADPRQEWSTNLFVLKGVCDLYHRHPAVANFLPRVQKELYMFDNPLYMQVHSKYDNFINVAETFVGVRSHSTHTTPFPLFSSLAQVCTETDQRFCFEVATPTKVYQLAAESFAEMQNWLANLDRIVQENLGAENRIIQMVDDLIAQREADLCDDLLAELENTEVPQRLVLIGTGTPPASQSPLVLSRSGALLEVSRSPDEEHGPSLLHRQALLRSSASSRSFEALPRGTPRSRQPTVPAQPPQPPLSRSPHYQP